LSSLFNVGMIVIFIIFQPEIRRFLQHLNTHHFIERGKKELAFLHYLLKDHTEQKLNIDAIVNACSRMSKEFTGALIVITQGNSLDYTIGTGEHLNAVISAPLLENIFFKNSPLHDGAVIISHNTIVAARCILPVSANPNIPASLGLRHRSAIGITEHTDALAIVVSEQTGTISLIEDGKIQRNITPKRLHDLLSAKFTNGSAKESDKKHQQA